MRQDISRLRKNRSINMKIGFIVALSAVFMAFNWTTYDRTILEEEYNNELNDFPDVEMIRTPRKEKVVLPPPIVKPSTNIMEEDIPEEFTEEPEPKLIETKITTNAKVVEAPVAPILKPRKQTAPPPAPKIEEPEEEDLEPILIADQMPRFPGCEDLGQDKKAIEQCAQKEMLEFIYKHIKYPTIARETTIQGTVVGSFVVEKDGSISDIEILRDIGGGCGKEVIKVVEKMPKWVPGKQKGRKVRVRYRIPVKFRLE